MAENHEPLPKSVRRFAPWTWTRQTLAVASIPALLLAYLLAAGPAMWLAGQYRPAIAAVAFIYRPLLLARQNDIDARDALDWYLGLWSRRGWFRVGSHHVFWFENDGRDGQMPSQQNIPPRS